MENKRFLTYTAIAACLICVIAVAFNVFTDFELPSRIMAAILGVVITATITQVLLQGQTQKEGTLKRDSKIFEEKLKIYQTFLNTLYKAVEDNKLTEKEKTELQFQTSLVAMHCDPKHITVISNAVKGVVKSTCPNKGDKTPPTALLDSLFDVVEAFRQDLYPDEFKKFDEKAKDDAIRNFNEAYEDAKEGEEAPREHLIVDLNMLSDGRGIVATSPTPEEDAKQDDSLPESKQDAECAAVGNGSEMTALWKEAVDMWQTAGWIVNPDPVTEDCPLLVKRNDGNPGIISMGFYDGHYYLQAKFENDVYFSKCLKWDNGGRRRYDEWWEYPALALDVPRGGFLQRFAASADLQEYIINKVEYLQSVIQKTYQTTNWMKAIGPTKDWNLFTWYWSTLACEYQNEAEGKIYMDTAPVEGKGVAAIQLGNRANDIEQLKQTLTRIGQADKIKDIQEDGCFVTLEETSSLRPEDVGGRLRYWIGRLSDTKPSAI